MYIPLSDSKSLMQIVEFGLREYRDPRIAETRKDMAAAQIETCRGQFRALVLFGKTIFYTARAESEDAAKAIAQSYVSHTFTAAVPRVTAFPANPVLAGAVPV